LTLRDVHARYEPRGAETLSGITFSLSPGRIVCVLGPNGAGKTTLVRVVSGGLAPEKGAVHLLDESVPGMDKKRLARSLAVVSQIEDQNHDFTVAEVVMMGRAPHQDAWLRERPEDRDVVTDVIARCRIQPLQRRLYRTLSGGEQKRVQIARALAQRPKVLVLDEPAAFLDVREQLALYELLASEVKEHALACLVVMHDLTAAAQMGHEVVLMKHGRVVATGSVEEVMTYRTLRETFDADLYCGLNEITNTRFFLPMRGGMIEPSE
jgi:iron complex transport system ATP-binding protein